MGKINRFKTEEKGYSLGPGQYNMITEWPGKGIKEKNSLLSSYRGIPKRIYNS